MSQPESRPPVSKSTSLERSKEEAGSVLTQRIHAKNGRLDDNSQYRQIIEEREACTGRVGAAEILSRENSGGERAVRKQ